VLLLSGFLLALDTGSQWQLSRGMCRRTRAACWRGARLLSNPPSAGSVAWALAASLPLWHLLIKTVDVLRALHAAHQLLA
jgi:hypothetical protein